MAIVPIPEKPVLPQPQGITDQPTTKFISGLNRNLYDILAVTARRANASTWIDPGDDQTAGKLLSWVGSANKVQSSGLSPTDLADLIALKAQIEAILATGNGLLAKTGAGAYAGRTITGASNQIVVTNGNGVAGNPLLAVNPLLQLYTDGSVDAGIDIINPVLGQEVGYLFYDHASNIVYLGANSRRVRLLGVPVDLTYGQLQFPAVQNPSTDPNTLDDYEEGFWTPGLAIDSGTGSFTYTAQSGQYVKIGRDVTVTLDVRWSAKQSGSGSLVIINLPFPVSGAGTYSGQFTVGYSDQFAGTLTGLAVAGPALNLYQDMNNIFSGSVVGTSGTIIGTAKYIAAA